VPAAHNAPDTLLWFNVIFRYRDDGIRPRLILLLWVFVGRSEEKGGIFISAGYRLGLLN